MPRVIGTLISAELATLHELQTVYGIRDAYDMLEIVNVDTYNRRKVEAYNDVRRNHS